MQIEEYFEFRAPNDIRVKGTRIGIETILYDFLHGSRSPEAIAADFPSLTLEQVYATITYYLHNQDAISAYVAEWIEHGERMHALQERNPTPVMLRLRRLRAERATPQQITQESPAP